MSASPEKLAATRTHRNPEHFRIAIVQAALAGKSYTTIADELGTNKGVVAGVVYRARKALRYSPAPIVPLAPSKQDKHFRRSQKRSVLVENPTPDVWQPRPVHILDVANHQCRWPLWKANAPFSEKFFCGLPVVQGEAYCPHCRGLSVATHRTDSFDKKHGFFKLTKRGRR